jgi:DNA polymerase I-like protein with 3'-5' exonuclease and polymerase domains
LKAWGYRIGNYKDAHEDWSKLSEEMVSYCKQDVEVTYSLYNKLKLKAVPDEAIWLEQEFARIIQRQEQYGVYFNLEKAQELHVELLRDKEDATRQLHSVFTPLFLPKGKLREQKDYKTKFPFTNRGITYVGSFQPIEYTAFNPSSRPHIATWFKRWYGWKAPQTDKGNPQVDESVLNGLEYPEAKILAHYFNVNKLLGQLAEGNQAWLKQVRGDTGRIHGSVNTLGAVSRRCSHSNPNMAQVPSVRAYKGKECRSLFCAPLNKRFMGIDAEGLELRMLAHYMYRYDKGHYGDVVANGKKENGTDIHTLNQKAAGLSTRDEAKTMIYAIAYGAGEAKIGSIVGGGFVEGKKIKAKFFQKIPALQKLTESVIGAVRARGTLKALDGNRYFIRSEHSALNTLLQGGGALLCKMLYVLTDNKLEELYTKSSNSSIPDYEFVLQVHDEFTIECNEGIAEEVGRIASEAIKVS